MTAEELTASLGGRWNGRSGLARCPSHNDHHPSFNITEKGGRVVFVCRAGCTQREVLEALRGRGSWHTSPAPPLLTPRVQALHLAADVPQMPPGPPCCLRGPGNRCQHWRAFDTDMTLATLHANLREAAAEVIKLFQIAKYELTRTELHRELRLAADLAGSAIVPWHLGAGIVGKMIDVIAAEVIDDAARAA